MSKRLCWVLPLSCQCLGLVSCLLGLPVENTVSESLADNDNDRTRTRASPLAPKLACGIEAFRDSTSVIALLSRTCILRNICARSLCIRYFEIYYRYSYSLYKYFLYNLLLLDTITLVYTIL